MKISVLEKNIKGQVVQSPDYKYTHLKHKGQVNMFLKMLDIIII